MEEAKFESKRTFYALSRLVTAINNYENFKKDPSGTFEMFLFAEAMKEYLPLHKLGFK